MSRFDSFELTAFNLEGQINLGERYGLIKILKSDDGKIVLVCDGEYGTLDQIKPTELSVTNTDAALGLVLDIGIRRERQLTIGGGFYAALPLMTVQSNRPIKQAGFDEGLFEQIKGNLDHCFQSGVSRKELLAIRLNQLIETYNNSRLLFPNFYNESYLGLMRIIDAVGLTWGADDFALAAASISPTLNEDICEKIKKINAYGPRVQIALGLFDERLLQVSKELRGSMATLDSNGKIVFACFYGAYQYRNKFVHLGFPFPRVATEARDIEQDLGTAYLSSVIGIYLPKRYSPGGVQEDDLIEIHEVLGDAKTAADFKNKYFFLLPTWHFMKRLARESLLNQIKQLP